MPSRAWRRACDDSLESREDGRPASKGEVAISDSAAPRERKTGLPFEGRGGKDSPEGVEDTEGVNDRSGGVMFDV